jgi:hypothetical protein
VDNQQTRRILICLLVAAALTDASLHLLRTFNDPDFFWHLKTGEWIWQNRSLPLQDPFAFTSHTPVSSLAYFTLTSYWLSQTIYYLLYLTTGLNGLIFLRFLLAGMLGYMVTKRRHGDSVIYLGLFTIFLTQFLEAYPFDRPQVFSFLLFAALLLLLEKIKSGNDAGAGRPEIPLVVLPVVMLVWSNLHGGYVLGQVVIILYMVMEGIKFGHPALRPISKSTYTKLVIAGAAGICCSLANPNTWHAFAQLAAMPDNTAGYISEFKSSIYIFRKFNDYGIILYWLILIMTGAGIILNFRQLDLTELALLAGTGYFSFTQIRYVAFFTISALPFISRAFSKGRILTWARAFIFTAALLIAVLFTWDEGTNIRNLFSGNWISPYIFPANAAEFIVKNDIRVNMYNYYDWGGYLIWRLGPERKVFIDGRGLYPDVYARSQFITYTKGTEIAGTPFWKAALDAYNVKCVMIPLFERSGSALPLVSALVRDKDWTPVFFYLNSMIFLKYSPENFPVTGKYSIPKDYFIDDLIMECDRLIKLNPGNIPPYIAKGDLYRAVNRPGAAREVYQKAIEISPSNPIARERLKLLNTDSLR